ncbi:hypothetical protein HBI38_070660 [Parastagonospora nodorum]|nr:hypothetical protein HBI41_071880 [Parastagonospora nodorum]KAH6324711.1 hypothetical protein HBI38_070660 [Parastagonospora nodorum]
MCAKDDLIRRKGPLRLAGELATAESVTAKDPNYVDTFSSDFAFSFANILSLIAFIISYCLFADKLNIQQSLLDRATVVLIIISVDKTQLLLISGDIARSTPSTLLARFIPITKIYNPLLKTLENAAKSRILLACVDGRTRQCYLTIYAILRCLNKGHDDFVHLVNCFRWKHYNFNIHVSLATDTLYLLLKGLLIAVVSLLFVSKAPFALHFIRAVYDLVTLAQYKSHDENILAYIQGALERMNVFKEEFRLIPGIQPYSTKLPLSKVAANIAISDFTHAAAVFLYLILTIINYTCYDKDRKHIAYIRAFSEVLLFNNNKQINNTTRILSVPFKFYDLSTIICLVHLVLRDLPNLTTRTTMSYYVNNYIN